MTPTPVLSIVVVSFNTRADLHNCLASLQAAALTLAHEIVVVDNASGDGSAAMVRERWPAVGVVDAGGNLGFAAANNIGIRASTGPYVLLLNSDTIVGAGALETITARLAAEPDAAAAGPRIVDGNGRAELSFGRMISPCAELRQKILVRLHDRGVGPVARHVEHLTRTRQDVDWVSGACLLVRRTDALAAGLLDERYFLYGEDVDFCAGLRGLGKRILFEPEAEIVHLRGRARATRPAASEQAYRRAHLAFYAKHHPAWYPWLRLYLRMRGKLPAAPSS